MVDWSREGSADAVNRGLLYGHGCFETVRLVDNRAPLLQYHEDRLNSTSVKLGFGKVPSGWLAQRLTGVDGPPDRVVRVVLTCAATGRGYAPPKLIERLWFAEGFPVPDSPDHGLRLGIQRISCGDPLPGAKHLARLSQVIAHGGAGSSLDDHLLVDERGCLVEALSSNVIVAMDGQWLTPDLKSGGVAGAFRSWLLGRGAIRIDRLHVGILERASALILVNAVRGYMPVQEVEYFGPYASQLATEFMRNHPAPW